MYLKVHPSPDSGDVVAVCDDELLNCTLRHGAIEFFVNETFYGNTPATEGEVRKALKNASSANLVGKQAVSIAVDMGILDEDTCIMIGDVPHAQIFQVLQI